MFSYSMMDRVNAIETMDAVEFMQGLEDSSATLIWTDPPFGTGSKQSLASTWTGTERLSYLDPEPKKALELIEQVLVEAHRVLADDGTLALLLDWRCIHEAIVIAKQVGFKHEGEIIYHFELGGTTKKWWTNKHNTIALFSHGAPKFDHSQVPETIRRAPRGAHQSELRKANSVWSYTMGPSNPERTGYPNQKPLAIVEPFVLVHADPGDLVVDPFCGSGVVAEAAEKNGRRYAICDINPEATAVASDRISLAADQRPVSDR